MAEQAEETGEHPGIRPEMVAEWKKYVQDAIENEPGDARAYALLLLAQVSALIRGLAEGLAPSEVIKLIQPNTSYVMMSPLLQAVCAFSVRGEDFRLWWNEWHDRVHPDDEAPPADRPSQRLIFKPWQINVKGRTLQLTGAFDPTTPLTKSPKYLENVNAVIKKLNEESVKA